MASTRHPTSPTTKPCSSPRRRRRACSIRSWSLPTPPHLELRQTRGNLDSGFVLPFGPRVRNERRGVVRCTRGAVLRLAGQQVVTDGLVGTAALAQHGVTPSVEREHAR